MDVVELKKDKTVRLGGIEHYTLKLLSLHTGRSGKELLKEGISELCRLYPQVRQNLVDNPPKLSNPDPFGVDEEIQNG